MKLQTKSIEKAQPPPGTSGGVVFWTLKEARDRPPHGSYKTIYGKELSCRRVSGSFDVMRAIFSIGTRFSADVRRMHADDREFPVHNTDPLVPQLPLNRALMQFAFVDSERNLVRQISPQNRLYSFSRCHMIFFLLFLSMAPHWA